MERRRKSDIWLIASQPLTSSMNAAWPGSGVTLVCMNASTGFVPRASRYSSWVGDRPDSCGMPYRAPSGNVRLRDSGRARRAAGGQRSRHVPFGAKPGPAAPQDHKVPDDNQRALPPPSMPWRSLVVQIACIHVSVACPDIGYPSCRLASRSRLLPGHTPGRPGQAGLGHPPGHLLARPGSPERDRESSKHEPGWCDMTIARLAAGRLNLNEAGPRRCSPPGCSHQAFQPPTWSRRQSTRCTAPQWPTE
jgi:hypothetical protein